MRRALFGTAFLLSIAFGAAGCGISDEDAQELCAAEAKAKQDACFDVSSFDMCVDCFKECGTEFCQAVQTCPLTYKCADAEATTSSSSSGM